MKKEELKLIQDLLKRRKEAFDFECKKTRKKAKLYFKAKEIISKVPWDKRIEVRTYDLWQELKIYITEDHQDPEDKGYDISWSVASLIQDTFSLEDGKIRKEFYPYEDDPKWYWEVALNKDLDLSIRIYWAEPDLDCTPKRNINTSITWSCEK